MNISLQSDQYVEATLVCNASQGDLDAFNALVRNYQDMAYHHAYALLGDQPAAEDAVQDSLIKAFQHIDRYRGGSFRAWLLKIVTNTAYDLLRKTLRRPTLPLFPEGEHGEDMEYSAWLADPAPSLQVHVERNEDAERLYRALDELPEPFRCVLTLIDLYEMDYAEVVKVLGIPMGTVKSRLVRARLQMRKKLFGQKEEPRQYKGERTPLLVMKTQA